MNNKSELRKFAKDLRKNLDIKVISEKILQTFLCSEIYENAKNIALYYPMNNELDLTELFTNKSKKYFLPKIDENDNMLFAKYTSQDDLMQGKYGIFEPISSELFKPAKNDILIMPALMADNNGYRLGYGKGYYDKFLADTNFQGVKVIFIPQKLLVNSLPINRFDIPANFIFTENQFFEIK